MPKKNIEIDKAIKRANIDELVKIVNKLDSAGRAVVLESIGTELTDTKKKKFIEKIKLSAIAADTETKKWLVGSMSEMYVGGINTADDKIKKYGIKTGAGKMTVEILKSAKEMSPHLASVNSLLSDAYLDFGNSMTGYVRGAEHIINDTMKKQIRQKLAAGRLDGASIREITKIVKEELGDRGFTVLIDRGGNQWNLKSYSEMLARTHLIKANNEATINRALDFDIDILEVSSHNTECLICKPYEGKKFSISGNSKEYPKLDVSFPLHPNCYSKDTEILTEKGWRFFKDVKKEDIVFSISPTTCYLEKVKVVKTFKYKEKSLIHFSNKIADILVTENHKMFYQNDEDRKRKKGEFRFKEAKELFGKKSGRFYASSKWKEEKECSVKFARFMGIWLSEGYVSKTKYNYIVGITQSKTVNPIKYELMLKIVKDYTKNKLYLDDNSIRFYDKDLGKYLLQFKKSPDKFIPQKIKQADKKVIREFLNAFLTGDGSIRKCKSYKKGNFENEITYHTSSKQMADDLGELILKVGKRPSYYLSECKGKMVKFKNGNYIINNNQWLIRECTHQYISMQNMKTERVIYNDFVYCVELEKNHTLYVRRNGKCVWSGNCKHSLLPRPDQT